MKKAQVSVEYILIIGIILLTFVLVFFFHSVKNIELVKSEDFLEKRSECLKISDTIAEAYTNEGSSVNLSLRYNVLVNSDSNSLYVEDVYCSLPIGAVYDNESNQEFNINKGSALFQNVNNSVIVTTLEIPPLPPTPACSSFETCSGCTANGCEWWDPWFGNEECRISCQGLWFGDCYETCPQECSIYDNCFDCLANDCKWSRPLFGSFSCKFECDFLGTCYDEFCPCSSYESCEECIDIGCKWCQKGEEGSCDNSCSKSWFGNCQGGNCYIKSCP